MKCPKCQMNIPDDSVYCPICGAQRDYTPPEVFKCTNCGTELEADAMFCPECGTPRNASDLSGQQPQVKSLHLSDRTEPLNPADSSQTGSSASDPQPQRPAQPYSSVSHNGGTHEHVPPYNPVKTRRNSGMIAAIAGGAFLLLLVVAAAFFYLGSSGNKNESALSSPSDTEDYSDSQINSSSDTTDSVDLSDVDYDLTSEDQLRMSGLIKTAQNGSPILSWDNSLTFYGLDTDGTPILMNGTQNAYIDSSTLPDNIMDEISANERYQIEGKFYFKDEALYITPLEILDTNGTDMIAKAESASSYSALNDPNGYILPQSNTRILTSSDIEGLSLQEINYAKNEIYARLGRKFKSTELQNYFNSKNWYHGTISPDSFSESLLSDIERKNADFLADTEFSMSPNSYQLDAN